MTRKGPQKPARGTDDEATAERTVITDFFAKAMTGVAKIKLSGGVVGRLAMITIVGMGTVATAAVASACGANLYVCGGVILSATFMLHQGFSWVLHFALKNPLTATMEGAELLVHQQLKNTAQRAKSEGRITVRRSDFMSDPDEPFPLPQPPTPDVPARSPPSDTSKTEG